MSSPALRPRKKEILEQAARLFLEKGFKATSVRDIAAAVGIEASSLYSHIRSKEEILNQLCDACADQYDAAIHACFADGLQHSIAGLEQIMGFHIDMAFNDPTSSTVFSDEWKNLPDKARIDFQNRRKAYENNFVQLLENLMQKGIIKKTDAQVMVNTLISSVRWIHHTKRKYAAVEKEKIRQELLRWMINGMK